LDNLLKENEKLVIQVEEQLKINEDDKKNHESLIEFFRIFFCKTRGTCIGRKGKDCKE
jgi:hypothetical protein